MKALLPTAFAAALMLSSTAALAHHTWLSRDAANGDVVMLWGHPGHDPEGPNKGSVVELKVFGLDGKATEIASRV
jgi:uncharacterized GH25 family protein